MKSSTALPPSTRPRLASFDLAPWALAVLVAYAAPALAQYKVVLPDGSVTYTDRPPLSTNARITSLNRKGTASTSEASPDTSNLPLELRQAVQRYPVTLYTGVDCAPCEAGRRALQQRGIPFSEKRVTSEDDASALERAVGGRTVPALTIGAQPLRGYSETDWTVFLDAAGYPRESRLPKNWQAPAPQALTERTALAKPTVPARPEAPPATPNPPETPSGTRF
jgi:glutaredoxin